MKAITLYQPWASLIAVQGKKFETRSWETSYRGLLAIHAGKKNPNDFDPYPVQFIAEATQIFKSSFAEAKAAMPLGAVVAISELAECYLIGQDAGGTFISKRSNITAGYVKYAYVKDKRELLFGDWTPGRFAWEIKGITKLSPIPARGMQGLWQWDETGLM